MTAISIEEAQRAVPNWRVGDGGLEVDLKAKDFRAAFEFLTKIADLAESQ